MRFLWTNQEQVMPDQMQSWTHSSAWKTQQETTHEFMLKPCNIKFFCLSIAIYPTRSIGRATVPANMCNMSHISRIANLHLMFLNNCMNREDDDWNGENQRKWEARALPKIWEMYFIPLKSPFIFAMGWESLPTKQNLYITREMEKSN